MRYPEAAKIRELEHDNAELRALFDLQHKRTLEADKLWQKAHNKPDTFPDLGNLIEWLLSERAYALTEMQCLKDGVLPNAYAGQPCDMCQHYYNKFARICEGCCHNYSNKYQLKSATIKEEDS